ncbi:hypothetical protein VS84_02551 [Vibrio cholerae]|nr:hypothetical protein VS84_02551 [Vibrio cholerae]KKP19284.1 hypothetical protein VS86_03063 [Vibrio cholerae]
MQLVHMRYPLHQQLHLEDLLKTLLAHRLAGLRNVALL